MGADNVTLVNRCPACDSEGYVRQVVIDDSSRQRYLRFSEIKYGGLLNGWLAELQPEIVACSECAHHWYLRQPSPEQLSQMYGNGRRLIPGAVLREPTQMMLSDMRRLAKLVGRECPRLLDFGSGFGLWARAAAQAKFRVHAYEPCETRGAELVDDFTLVHDLSEIAGLRFDAINLEQVLEHVPNPQETLRTITAFCTPNTVLRIRVPNILRPAEGSKVWADWPYDGKRVHSMAPFEHLHGFTPDSLRRTVTGAGFRPIARHNMAWSYPHVSARYWLRHWFPRLDQTFLIVRPYQS